MDWAPVGAAVGAEAQVLWPADPLVVLGLLPVVVPLFLQAPDEGVQAGGRALLPADAVFGAHGLQFQHQLFVWWGETQGFSNYFYPSTPLKDIVQPSIPFHQHETTIKIMRLFASG